MAVDSAIKRASIQAYSGDAPSLVARIDASPSLSNTDRAHVTGIYRGAVPSIVTGQALTYVDTAVLGNAVATANLDASISTSFSASVNSDVAAQNNVTALSFGDGVVLAAAYVLDAQLDASVVEQAPGSIQCAADIAVESFVSTSTALDLVVSPPNTIVAAQADAIALASMSVATPADGAVMAAGEIRQTGASVAALEAKNAPVALESAVQSPQQASSLFDAGVAFANTLQALADLVAARSTADQISAESAIEATLTLQTGLDALVQTSGILAVAEVAIQSERQAGALIDGVAAQVGLAAATIEAAILGTITASANADTATQLADRSVASSLEIGVAIAADAISASPEVVAQATRDLTCEFSAGVESSGVLSGLAVDAAVAYNGIAYTQADIAALKAIDADVGLDTTVEARGYVIGTSLDTMVYNYNPFLPAPGGMFMVSSGMEIRDITGEPEDRVISGTAAEIRSVL